MAWICTEEIISLRNFNNININNLYPKIEKTYKLDINEIKKYINLDIYKIDDCLQFEIVNTTKAFFIAVPARNANTELNSTIMINRILLQSKYKIYNDITKNPEFIYGWKNESIGLENPPLPLYELKKIEEENKLILANNTEIKVFPIHNATLV